MLIEDAAHERANGKTTVHSTIVKIAHKIWFSFHSVAGHSEANLRSSLKVNYFSNGIDNPWFKIRSDFFRIFSNR